ncbi:hypothetical protein L3X38_017385 [Prunus dulcis]|uniref:Uncharacterized protein n=1 Tax=Prunus dulcis TaxID=3755 RepID=A0AAD4W780_PRUDU|nr:hypothetical protein L3X38_017385 [Prunus dulcis]
MMTCIILHNMILEDEYDYDALEVYEPDPMNTTLTRIYERPMGPSGEPFEPEPLVRDGRLMTRMIDRYTEMQSSYIHERRQVDLMEHLWAVKGNLRSSFQNCFVSGDIVTSRDRLRRRTILSALGPPLCPHGFVSGNSRATSQWVTHPGIALAPNSLNFGVPTAPKPVSSQKTSC